ncbi:MAG TPA: mannose-1-phosphate guanylyltransferase [Syntrophomonadaceae bacterium]|nr:mannose-1-phosphate guanylyltransferase [Syntrophomonadaceae bacterium]
MIAVILAGGRGLRLWPESRQSRPKQLCKFVNNRSMLDHTIDRLSLSGATRITIITNDSLYLSVKELVDHRADADIIDILSEPEGKNTAPAVGLVLSLYHEKYPDETIGIFPADHHVLNVEAFKDSIRRACLAAGEGNLVTIGIAPSRPETGYGYIEKTRFEVGQIPGVYEVNSFYEKPDTKTASDYIASGNHMWNSGIYIGTTNTLMQEFKEHLPTIYEKMLLGHDGYLKSYSTFPNISLDYGIAEKSKRIAVVDSDFGWCDLGSWEALAELHELDENNNICNGDDIVAIESKDCIIQQSEKSIVTFGLENLLIVETDEVIFIANRDNSQDFRVIVDILKNKDRQDLL